MRGRSLLAIVFLLAARAAAADTLQDCRHCPRLVVIAGGTFTMGSPEDEPDRLKFEGPRAGVRVATFAIGETEVTRAQYAAFVTATHRPPPSGGCFEFGFGGPDGITNPHASWRNPGFGQTDAHPVTCISWQDAHDYAAWLAKVTGKPYRLPSEAEWEYAARGGTTTRFFWGTDEHAACEHANVADPTLLRANTIVRELTEEGQRQGDPDLRIVHCEDGQVYTAPAKRYPPNPFGLYDVIGNLWEYVEDCWQEALPETGAAQEQPGCEARRVRGGSWDDTPPELRSARRSRVRPEVPRNDGGFRLARDLVPGEVARTP